MRSRLPAANRCAIESNSRSMSYTRPGSSGSGSARESRWHRLSWARVTISEVPSGATSHSRTETSATG